jgi:parallel beta-helix repeat protein
MKTTKLLASIMVIVGVLALSSAINAGNLEPSNPPASTMKTLDQVEPRIPIGNDTTPGDFTALYVISQPGSYYLTGNITINFKHAIRIDSSDVTLDLMGYRLYSSYLQISGDTDFDGIHIGSELNNIEIRNGSIVSNKSQSGLFYYNGFRHGIYVAYTVADPDYLYSQNIRVFNVRVTGSRGYGICLHGSNHTVKGCTASDNGSVGIKARHLESESSGTNFLISENTANNNGAIGIYTSVGAIVKGNRCSHNGTWGINASTDCVISKNTCDYNTYEGISVWYGCLIEKNSCCYNSQAGIRAYWYSRVDGNTCYRNGEVGLDFAGGKGSVTNNICGCNQYEGIKVGGNSLVDGNSAYENDQSGGGYDNLSIGSNCTIGLNHAP